MCDVIRILTPPSSQTTSHMWSPLDMVQPSPTMCWAVGSVPGDMTGSHDPRVEGAHSEAATVTATYGAPYAVSVRAPIPEPLAAVWTQAS